MLAKPEYSSPPDEVCCWLGRRDRAVAGRGAAAKSHREDAAGRGRRSGRDTAGLGRREVRKGRRGAALGTLRVGDPALGTVGRCRIAKAARREPCAWEPVLGNLRGGPCAGNPCWVTSVGDPALGNKGVLGASGLYLNQLRGFCFVVPCQSSK